MLCGREVFEDILVGLGVPDPPVDAFATEANHLCPIWWVQEANMRTFCAELEGTPFVDELPYSMLDKVVHKITEDGASAILVVPHWPHRLWWRRVQVMVFASLFFPRGHRVFELLGRVCGPSRWGTWAFFITGTFMVD